MPRSTIHAGAPPERARRRPGRARRTHLALASVVALLGSLGIAPGSAAAEPRPEDRALAAVLFDEGRALLAEGKTAEACGKLEASQGLDPGGGTLLNLALCHEALGRTATAYAELVEARGVARRDGRADREALAQEHLDAITPRLSYLVVRVAAPPSPGLRVTRDGSELAPGTWGVRAPVDPGAHRVEATAVGHAPFTREVVIERDAQIVEVAIPPLAPLPAAAPPPVAPPAAPASAPTRPTAPPPGPGLGPLRVGALVAGGLAVVAVGVGAVGGVIAMSEESDAEEIGGDCVTTCPPDAVQHGESAQASADVATVGFVAAAALATTAVVLWLVGDDAAPATARRAGATPGLTVRF